MSPAIPTLSYSKSLKGLLVLLYPLVERVELTLDPDDLLPESAHRLRNLC